MGRFRRISGVSLVAGPALIVGAAFLACNSLSVAGPMILNQRVEHVPGIPDEDDVNAPVDYGPGPGVKPSVDISARTMAASQFSTSTPTPSQIPTGTASANTAGVFGPVMTWPLIPIHAVLLPGGRVMNFGTGATGIQGAQFIYDVWDPTLGSGTNAHLVLPNTTNTDIFCSAQSLMVSGEVLTSGGDLTVNGVRNSANNDTTIFTPNGNTLKSNTPMKYARWYGSLVALPNGQLAIFGGRQNVGQLTPAVQTTTPEIYDPGQRAWTALTGANSNTAFGAAGWYYPRAYVAPGGKVFVLVRNGQMYYVSMAGTGGITKSNVVAPAGADSLPTISFAPGLALSLRQDKQVVVVDYRTSTPVVTATDDMDQVRFWASGSIMADGKVLITGGSEVQNELTGVAYQAQIWDPATGHWTRGATATKPRLYHSNSLLLPDATVLTGGGGAPGPVKNLNAEIYYPPYLYKADGTPAVRPYINTIASKFLSPGDTLDITVGPTTHISRLTFIRTGSATHSYNSDQRFFNLAFDQEGQNITAVLPTDTTTLVPGYYMLFAFDRSGVPSVAKIVNVD